VAAAETRPIDVPTWLRTHYELVDAGLLEEYLDDFAENVELRFGALPPVRGKDAVRAALARGHDAHAMSHEFVNVWEAGTTTIVEFAVTYTYPGGASRTTPVVTILAGPPGAIGSMRIFLDRTVHEGEA